MFDQYIQSELLLHCLKKCLNRKDISTEVKEKIALLLYEDFDFFEAGKEVNISNQFNKVVYNPLGVDDDLLYKSSETLSQEQVEHLRLLIIDEIRKYQSFYSSMRSEIKSLPPIESSDEHIELIESSFKKQAESLEDTLKFKTKMERLRFEVCQRISEMSKKTLAESNKVIRIERKLFEEIVQQISYGNRGEALEKVERILEEKVARNKETIQQLKFELSEYKQ